MQYLEQYVSLQCVEEFFFYLSLYSLISAELRNSQKIYLIVRVENIKILYKNCA